MQFRDSECRNHAIEPAAASPPRGRQGVRTCAARSPLPGANCSEWEHRLFNHDTTAVRVRWFGLTTREHALAPADAGGHPGDLRA